MYGRVLWMVVAATLCVSVSAADRRGGGEVVLPALSVRRLKALVRGYHANRALLSNYGQTAGQLQYAVSSLLAKSDELRKSAAEALDIAQAKVRLALDESLPQQQVQQLDARQDQLVAGISAMADSLSPSLTRLAASLQTMASTRVLLFARDESGAAAFRRLAHLLNHTYYVHGTSMKPAHRRQLRRLARGFERHRAEVKLGEPDNDLTSSAAFEPNNTVFSRHPENLRHNAHAAQPQALAYDDVKEVGEDEVAEDASRLGDDLARFGDELLGYIQDNASQMYFTGTPTGKKDALAKKMAEMAGSLREAKRKNTEAMRRLLAAQY